MMAGLRIGSTELLPSKFIFDGHDLCYVLFKKEEHAWMHAKVRFHQLKRYFWLKPQLLAHRLQQVLTHLFRELLSLLQWLN